MPKTVYEFLGVSPTASKKDFENAIKIKTEELIELQKLGLSEGSVKKFEEYLDTANKILKDYDLEHGLADSDWFVEDPNRPLSTLNTYGAIHSQLKQQTVWAFLPNDRLVMPFITDLLNHYIKKDNAEFQQLQQSFTPKCKAQFSRGMPILGENDFTEITTVIKKHTRSIFHKNRANALSAMVDELQKLNNAIKGEFTSEKAQVAQQAIKSLHEILNKSDLPENIKSDYQNKLQSYSDSIKKAAQHHETLQKEKEEELQQEQQFEKELTGKRQQYINSAAEKLWNLQKLYQEQLQESLAKIDTEQLNKTEQEIATTKTSLQSLVKEYESDASLAENCKDANRAINMVENATQIKDVFVASKTLYQALEKFKKELSGLKSDYDKATDKYAPTKSTILQTAITEINDQIAKLEHDNSVAAGTLGVTSRFVDNNSLKIPTTVIIARLGERLKTNTQMELEKYNTAHWERYLKPVKAKTIDDIADRMKSYQLPQPEPVSPRMGVKNQLFPNTI